MGAYSSVIAGRITALSDTHSSSFIAAVRTKSQNCWRCTLVAAKRLKSRSITPSWPPRNRSVAGQTARHWRTLKMRSVGSRRCPTPSPIACAVSTPW